MRGARQPSRARISPAAPHGPVPHPPTRDEVVGRAGPEGGSPRCPSSARRSEGRQTRRAGLGPRQALTAATSVASNSAELGGGPGRAGPLGVRAQRSLSGAPWGGQPLGPGHRRGPPRGTAREGRPNGPGRPRRGVARRVEAPRTHPAQLMRSSRWSEPPPRPGCGQAAGRPRGPGRVSRSAAPTSAYQIIGRLTASPTACLALPGPASLLNIGLQHGGHGGLLSLGRPTRPRLAARSSVCTPHVWVFIFHSQRRGALLH